MSVRLGCALLSATIAGSLWGAVCRADQPTGGAAPPARPGAASGAPSAPTAAPSSTPAQPEGWRPDNRLILSGNHDTLTGTNGGAGGSINYLGEPTPNSLLGIGAEYQKLATSNWEFASFSGAYSHPLTARSRWNVHAEAHEGVGRAPKGSFDYSIVAAGAGATAPGGLTFDLEERQIDVQTSHGSLPKLTLSEPFGRHWLTTLAYAHSFGGNLNTSYGLARVDFFATGFSLLAGGTLGRVSPAVINIQGVLQAEAHHLSEVFLGITKPIERVDVMLLGDELDLEGIKRTTVTLNITVHL